MKRLTAMVLVICIFFSMQPAFAYAESTPEKEEKTETRTIEEILDEYHRKSLEAELGGEKNTGTSSRSATSGKTLEQETVEELNAAGYEAYNVTSDNYESLERTLKTDFGSLGLDPDGSYIITISGDEENTSNNSNSRGRPNIEEVGGPGGGGDGYEVFLHTYNGTTYSMRYVTVSANSDEKLREDANVIIDDYYGPEDLYEDVGIYISILSSVGLIPGIGELYTWISALESYNEGGESGIVYHGSSNWHIKYIQVYDHQNSVWVTAASTEYVTVLCSLIEWEYDQSMQGSVAVPTLYYSGTIYSANYNNTTLMKDRAALAFINELVSEDTVEYVKHKFEDEVVLTQRRDIDE